MVPTVSDPPRVGPVFGDPPAVVDDDPAPDAHDDSPVAAAPADTTAPPTAVPRIRNSRRSMPRPDIVSPSPHPPGAGRRTRSGPVAPPGTGAEPACQHRRVPVGSPAIA